MPVNSIGKFVKATCEGITSQYLPPVVALLAGEILPPIVPGAEPFGISNSPIPYAFVWIHPWDEKRESEPRHDPTAIPGAWKKASYAVEVDLEVQMDASAAHRDSAFPCLIDAVQVVFNQITIPQTLTDPDTGFQSELLTIGEVIRGEQFAPEALGTADQGLMKYGAVLIIEVEEMIQY